MCGKVLQTIVETKEFIKQSQTIAPRTIIEDFIVFIAHNPLRGDLIQGTGGIRKIRWHKNKSSGKSGGIRILYYYHDQSIPIFLLTAYAKNKKENISEKDKITLNKIMQQLVTTYQDGAKYD
jgi:hypothetical protein